MQKNIDHNVLVIMPMLDEHLSRVAEIEQSVFHNPWTRDMYAAELLKDYSHHFVLLYKDKVVGYYGIFNTTPDEAEVTNVAIDEAYQGKGLGDILVTHMIDQARLLGMHKVFLETRETNMRARRLYEKHGFKLINIRKKYYDGVENARIYMWED